MAAPAAAVLAGTVPTGRRGVGQTLSMACFAFDGALAACWMSNVKGHQAVADNRTRPAGLSQSFQTLQLQGHTGRSEIRMLSSMPNTEPAIGNGQDRIVPQSRRYLSVNCQSRADNSSLQAVSARLMMRRQPALSQQRAVWPSHKRSAVLAEQF